MKVDLSKLINKNDTVAVAVSGGSDSMALLDYMLQNQKLYNYSVIALNIEHGIRGEESLRDSSFVKDYCQKNNIPLLSYSVNSIEYSRKNGLTVEEGARKLRYDCFYQAIESGKCDKIATAHHLSDNFESILINLFRGTGIRGLTGIKDDINGKIIRPFVKVPKQEITEYIAERNIPFVTDSTNFDSDYTRNFLRLNVIPRIKEVFPEAEKSAIRLSEILQEDCSFIESQVESYITDKDDDIYIKLPCPSAILSRATILSIKKLGIEKDWAKVHIDEVIALSGLKNGARINLPKNVVAIKEYDRICLYKEREKDDRELPFAIGKFSFSGKEAEIKKVAIPSDIKKGFYADLDKIPKDCVIRTKREGDIFTKFGGGSKKLNDYLTDKKIPLKDRDTLPVLAKDNIVYFIFQIAISDLIKVDEKSRNIVQFV